MLEGISDDINAVIDWELSHGNMVEGRVVSNLTLEEIVVFRRPLTIANVSPTLKEWSWEDPHYGETEWRRGYQSTVSNQIVCGPSR